MRLSKIANLMMVVPFVLAACGGEDGEPMTGLLESFEGEAAELETLAAAHDTAVGGAADLAAIQAEESSYGTEASAIYEEMEHAMGEMTECTHDDHGPDLGDMGAAMTDLDDELAAHAAAMAGAADETAALAEEDRHQTALAAIITALDGVHDALHDEAADFMCPAGHHEEGTH